MSVKVTDRLVKAYEKTDYSIATWHRVAKSLESIRMLSLLM